MVTRFTQPKFTLALSAEKELHKFLLEMQEMGTNLGVANIINRLLSTTMHKLQHCR
jgi:hypothetical protein